LFYCPHYANRVFIIMSSENSMGNWEIRLWEEQEEVASRRVAKVQRFLYFQNGRKIKSMILRRCKSC
jgi:hypothetical protein